MAKECHTYENNVIIEELIFRGCLKYIRQYGSIDLKVIKMPIRLRHSKISELRV